MESCLKLQEISRKMRSLFLVLVTLQCFQMLSFGFEEPSKLYIVYLGEKQREDPDLVTASHHDILTRLLGSKEHALSSIVYSYRHGFSGFAARLTGSQAKTVADLPEVISITPDRNLRLHTTRSWDFLGLNYNQPQGLLHKTNYGDGIIVGVVDSGIWPESRSFEDTGYGPIPSRWRGKCQVGQLFNTTHCNRKLIGARWYAASASEEDLKEDYLSPRDFNGHGTHTSSTVAGNFVVNASYLGLAAGVARGGAPRARLAMYKICWGSGGSCGTADMIKAVDDAIHDGVDVLSLSLGGGTIGLPYASLHAVAKGITVVFAGGNDGPATQTVDSDSPWVITVAASTVDRSFPTVITLGDNQKLVGQSIFPGTNHDNDFTELIFSDSCGKEALNPNVTAGKMVLCGPSVRESVSSVEFQTSALNVKQARGKGLIFAHNSDSALEATTLMCDQIPCVLIDLQTKNQIFRYAQATSKPVVKVAPTYNVIGSEVLAPRIAAFSSRGPSTSYPGQIKPDIAAPGANILAAVKDSYEIESGTSMACPHVSGVVAVLKSLHPNWSPAAIKSALITTASITDAYGVPIEAQSIPKKLADPFDFGGGVVNPNRAADPGLLYDIESKEYFKFVKFFKCDDVEEKVCDVTHSLPDLNLPSIAIPDLRSTARTVWRTVTNVGKADAIYNAVVQTPPGVKVVIEPSVFHFNASVKMQSFKITFSTTRKVQGDYQFGGLTWVEKYGTHSVRIPIAVRTVIQDRYANL